MHPCPWEEKIDPFSWNYDNLLSLQISFLSKFHKLLLAKTMGMKLKMHLQIVRSKMTDTGQVSSPLVKNLPLPHQEEDIYEDIQWEWATTTNDWCSLYWMTEEVAMEVKAEMNVFPLCASTVSQLGLISWYFSLSIHFQNEKEHWFWRKLKSLIVALLTEKKEEEKRVFFWRAVGGCGEGRVCMLNILNS